MKRRPLLDKASSGTRGDTANQKLPREGELGMLTLILGMEVGRFMVPVEHPDDDPEEAR